MAQSQSSQSGKVPMGRLMDAFNAAREAEQRRTESVRIGVLVDQLTNRQTVLAVRDALLPVHAGATLSVSLVGTGVEEVRAATWDLGIVIAGGSDRKVAQAVRTMVRQGIPVAVVAETALDAPDIALPEEQARMVTVVAASDQRVMVRALARWLVTASPKATALAANFPFCRKARVDELVRSYATKNAAAGAMASPDSETTAMLSSQARLYVEIAAAYGREPSVGRALEMLGVMWAGYGYGAIARSTLGLIPGSGWALRAGVGYLGTWTTAKAVATYFDRQDSGEKLVHTPKVVERAGEAVRNAARRKASDVIAKVWPFGGGDSSASFGGMVPVHGGA